MKRIWLVTVGEPSPIDNNIRLHRTGLLADSLSKQGFSVTLFNSTFSHQEKKQRFQESKIINFKKNLDLAFIFGRQYMKNISFQRVLSNHDNSLELKKLIKPMQKPDIVICAFPILGLVKEVSEYCKKNHVPWIIDIRDFWPDVFLEIFPKFFRPLLRLIFFKFHMDLKQSIRKANFIISPFDGTKKWLNMQFPDLDIGDNYQTIPFTYPSPLNEINVADKTRVIINKDADCIITLAGNISEFSNIDHLFEIERQAISKGKKIQIIVCGSGPKYEYYLRKSNSLGSSIIFTGLLDQPSLAYILSNSDYGFLGYDSKHLVKGVPNKIIEYTCYSLKIIINSAMEICSIPKFNEVLIPYSLENLDELISEVFPKVGKLDKCKIKNFYKENFSEEIILRKYTKLIKKTSAS